MNATPGPWVQRPYRADIVIQPAGSDESDDAIAQVLESPDMQANAALIAAAPDLLEALWGMLTYYTGGAINHPVHRAAIAAINKARRRHE